MVFGKGYQMKTEEEVKELLILIESTGVYIKDDANKMSNDSFVSALRWVLG